MIYTALTRKALKLAYDAHDGQVDQAGVPYIFHPYHLAEQMNDEVSVCVALLHDVVEDTEVTLDYLKERFPDTVIEALSLLSHDPMEDYFNYVRRIKTNSVAKMVKLADLEHNSDESRLEGVEGISAEKRESWRKKYKKAKEILQLDVE